MDDDGSLVVACLGDERQYLLGQQRFGDQMAVGDRRVEDVRVAEGVAVAVEIRAVFGQLPARQQTDDPFDAFGPHEPYPVVD